MEHTTYTSISKYEMIDDNIRIYDSIEDMK